jgi:hypothetical protein
VPSPATHVNLLQALRHERVKHAADGGRVNARARQDGDGSCKRRGLIYVFTETQEGGWYGLLLSTEQTSATTCPICRRANLVRIREMPGMLDIAARADKCQSESGLDG